MKQDINYHIKNNRFYRNASLVASFVSLTTGVLAINKALFGNLYETTAFILQFTGIGFLIAAIAFLSLSNSYSKTIKRIKNSL